VAPSRLSQRQSVNGQLEQGGCRRLATFTMLFPGVREPPTGIRGDEDLACYFAHCRVFVLMLYVCPLGLGLAEHESCIYRGSLYSGRGYFPHGTNDFSEIRHSKSKKPIAIAPA
jgi:hypothetical protein